MRTIAWFQLVVGAAMLLLWALLLATGQVPEIVAGQADIWFHVVAEVVAALLLLAGGRMLLRRVTARARLLSGVALGALLYTAINSPGYYAEAGDWAPVVMFAGLLVVTVVALVVLLRGAGEDDGPSDERVRPEAADERLPSA